MKLSEDDQSLFFQIIGMITHIAIVSEKDQRLADTIRSQVDKCFGGER